MFKMYEEQDCIAVFPVIEHRFKWDARCTTQIASKGLTTRDSHYGALTYGGDQNMVTGQYHDRRLAP